MNVSLYERGDFMGNPNKLKKISIDWEKRFKNLYVNTSALKNFLRLDWTKKSKTRKENYNKEVEFTINLAGALNDGYNKLVDSFNELSEKYTSSYDNVGKRIYEALRDKDSVESRLDALSKGMKAIDSSIGIANTKFEKSGVNLFKCKYTKIDPPTDRYKILISENNKKIKSYQERLENTNSEIKIKKSMLSACVLALNSARLQQSLSQDRGFLSNSRIKKYEQQERNLEREIDKLTATKEKCEQELANIWDKLVEKGDKEIQDRLTPIRGKIKQCKESISKVYSFYKNFEAEIEAISKEGNILSKDNLLKFNDQVNKNFSEIKALENMADIESSKENYGAGFFKLISTKEKKLEELKKRIRQIKNETQKSYEKMQAYTNTIQKYDSSSSAKGAQDDIITRLNGIEESSAQFKVKIDALGDKIEELLNQTDIHTIRPFKSENGFINKVCEIKICF